MLDHDAIQYLVETVDKNQRVVDVHDDGDHVYKLFTWRGGIEVKSFDKKPVSRNHTFTTLEGLLAYLNGPNCVNDSGILFVGNEGVHVELAYRSQVPQMAYLSFTYSPEYRALQDLMHGVEHRKLWSLLNSDLYDTIDRSLLLAIGGIRLRANGDTSVKINDFGVVSRSEQSSITIEYADPSGKNGMMVESIPTEWNWSGRVYTCFDELVNIQLRLEVFNKNGLIFVFHSRNLLRVIDGLRNKLIKRIAGSVPKQFTVHEGEYEKK